MTSLDMAAARSRSVRGERVGIAVPRWIVVSVMGRLLTTAFVLLGVYTSDGPPPVTGAGVGPRWLRPWTYFDAPWYLRISGSGYRAKSSAFFPLYPMLLRLGGSDVVHRAVFGVVLSNVAFFAAASLLHRLTERDLGTRVAEATVAVVSILPFAAVWSAVYTESLTLLLVVGCFWFVRAPRPNGGAIGGATDGLIDGAIGRWGLVAPLALAAGLTRNVGLALSAALLCEWLTARRRGSAARSAPWWGAVVAALPGVASCGFLAWGSMRFGSAGGLGAQTTFGRAWAWPWWAMWKDSVSPVGFGCIVALVSCLLGVGWLVRHRTAHPLSSSVLVLAVMAMFLLMAKQQRPHTLGAARYLMVAFPFSQSAAMWWLSRGRIVRTLVLVGAVALCAVGSWTIGRGYFELG